MSKPSGTFVFALRKPNRYVVWSTPAISLRPAICCMKLPAGIWPGGGSGPGRKLAVGLQLVSAAAEPEGGGGFSCALAGRGWLAALTGAGSTGTPVALQAASRPAAATNAASAARFLIG